MKHPMAPVFISLYSLQAHHSVWINTNEILSFEPTGKNNELSLVYIGTVGRYLVVSQSVDKIISLLGLEVSEQESTQRSGPEYSVADDDEDVRRRLSGDSYFETDGERTE